MSGNIFQRIKQFENNPSLVKIRFRHAHSHKRKSNQCFSLTKSFSLHDRLLAALSRWCFTWWNRAGVSTTSPTGAIPLTEGRKATQMWEQEEKNIYTNKKQANPRTCQHRRAKTRLELHHINHFYLLSAPTFGLGLPWPSPGRRWQRQALAN